MTTLLSVENIVVRYKQPDVVKGISLDVDRGAVVAIIGPNGAGKTTTLRAISGLTRPVSGRIRFGTRRIDALPSHEIVKLGIAHVPEQRRLFPQMSVIDNLLMGAHLQKDRTKTKNALDAVFSRFPVLKQRQKQYAGSLSGGEQQMLAIGRALMSDPQLLLLDEPSIGLAPYLVAEIGNIIRDISKEGLSVVLVEQNVFFALTLAQRGFVLERGEIVLAGTAKELLGNKQVKETYLGQ